MTGHASKASPMSEAATFHQLNCGWRLVKPVPVNYSVWQAGDQIRRTELL